MKTLDQVPQGAEPALVAELDRLAGVAAELAQRIARGGIDENLAGAAGTNTDGDAQKALDVIADEAFMTALREGDVRHYASEEQDTVVTMNPEGQFAIAIDPLDGSSNIDTNVSIGTIFGIYPAADTPEASFLRPGRDLLASGYAIFGPQCALIVTLGDGVLKYVLDPQSGTFRLLGQVAEIAPDSNEYAINTSNYRHWSKPIRAYIDDRVAGTEGPSGADSNMRWIASLVAETHRILTRGGIFLYPADGRQGYGRGRLRYVYECAPIAFLIEQAGGRATDGQDPILDAVPDTLHMRTPFVFGSSNKVARVATYHDLPDEETSALFGLRGLFRA
ncbi:class 1 fructose-bisphosphatase [Phaeobacter gallaeciensis]|uniref:class 1 fructose-bisphosphatase n=1 Tax=Phaeobacter gallaeciensis TaxID=60890 RepID=UPI00237F082D|nr:class 1 fructose-bisphosphatase [Phaeobacter gallaeciensis]MDE4192811.1 class 1 fructose-bisphosphatase [Phaeobacter gallaeciensis]MDE4201092.1 class 1 fructose-bisphosphatase [Phaeobacter gallaeciensis]MDE4205427.1 class 1 fructose-bisphosphatase [Phaeobacter gallaeciensis]MDE4209415.1 class 1 fructose-bisphosphatase [Phaeobacter gallaeciensis]MDE4217934.1 class 1 fructose-bisphosphatase [Phaeobacter gallaeciensis]